MHSRLPRFLARLCLLSRDRSIHLIHNIAILIRENLPFHPDLERFSDLAAPTLYAGAIRYGANQPFPCDRTRLLLQVEELYRFAQQARAAQS